MSSTQIQVFIQNAESSSKELHKCLLYIRERILSYPDIAEDFKYGGILFLKGNEGMNGIFLYKNYISLEFGKGYLLDDADMLEGSGKFRRHIKIYKFLDIEKKEVFRYIDEMYGKF